MIELDEFHRRTARSAMLIALATLAVLVLDGACAPATADEPADASPRIAECRIGFDGVFKVGHWTPVAVAVSGDAAGAALAVEVTAADNDGVPVTVSAPVPNSAKPVDGIRQVRLSNMVGRVGGSVTAKLVSEDGRVVDRRQLSTALSRQSGPKFAPLPASGELVLQIGPGSLGLADEFAEQDEPAGGTVRRFVQLEDVDALPTDWFGYDAVDVVVLTTGDVDFCQRLVDDEPRFAALRKWVELGGRIVVCGGRTAPQVFTAGDPLADFVPGRLVDLVRLPQTQAIETYAGSGDAISRSGAQQNIPLPRLDKLRGRVELFGRSNDLPIVIRAAHGLGELTFVGIDLSAPPFDEWTGRRAFLRTVLRPYLVDPDAMRTRRKLVSLGYDDLAGALRQRLGREFAGVRVISFGWVAALVIGYLVLLGPLDYLFVERVTRRAWVAWLTLPVIVSGVGIGAALLAGAAKNTDGRRINHAELVDFDLTTGRTRGSCWATLYSPLAERIDVALAPRRPDDRPTAGAQTLASWLGLPGSGLGGMHAAGEPIDVAGAGYRQALKLTELTGLPILTASTKSLFAGWNTGPDESVAPPLAADLALDDDGLVVGSITNKTGAELRGAYLLHGQTGYRVGTIEPGQRIDVGPSLSPLPAKTIIARRAGRSTAVGPERFLASRATADELLTVMMFYTAAGGEGFAELPNRYQSRCDLSRLLDFDRVLLVANGSGSGSQWIDAGGSPLAGEQGALTVVYRFVLPVNH